jgi:hypothetical protein
LFFIRIYMKKTFEIFYLRKGVVWPSKLFHFFRFFLFILFIFFFSRFFIFSIFFFFSVLGYFATGFSGFLAIFPILHPPTHCFSVFWAYFAHLFCSNLFIFYFLSVSLLLWWFGFGDLWVSGFSLNSPEGGPGEVFGVCNLLTVKCSGSLWGVILQVFWGPSTWLVLKQSFEMLVSIIDWVLCCFWVGVSGFSKLPRSGVWLKLKRMVLYQRVYCQTASDIPKGF